MPSIVENKLIVGRWFTELWRKTRNLDVVDELPSPDMLLLFSARTATRAADIKTFMADFRRAFPDLNFRGTAELIG